jgi:hypothetical protein
MYGADGIGVLTPTKKRNIANISTTQNHMSAANLPYILGGTRGKVPIDVKLKYLDLHGLKSIFYVDDSTPAIFKLPEGHSLHASTGEAVEGVYDSFDHRANEVTHVMYGGTRYSVLRNTEELVEALKRSLISKKVDDQHVSDEEDIIDVDPMTLVRRREPMAFTMRERDVDVHAAVESACGAAVVPSHEAESFTDGSEISGIRHRNRSMNHRRLGTMLIWWQGATPSEAPDGKIGYDTGSAAAQRIVQAGLEREGYTADVIVSPTWNGWNWDAWADRAIDHVFWTKSSATAASLSQEDLASKDPYLHDFMYENANVTVTESSVMVAVNDSHVGVMVPLDVVNSLQLIREAAAQFVQDVISHHGQRIYRSPQRVSGLFHIFRKRQLFPAYWAEPTSRGYYMYDLQTLKVRVTVGSRSDVIRATYSGQANVCPRLLRFLISQNMGQRASRYRTFLERNIPYASNLFRKNRGARRRYVLGLGAVAIMVPYESIAEYDFLYVRTEDGLIAVLPDVEGEYYTVGPTVSHAGIGVQCAISLIMAADGSGRTMKDRLERQKYDYEPSGHVIQSVRLSTEMFCSFAFELCWNFYSTHSAYALPFNERTTGRYHTYEEYLNGIDYAYKGSNSDEVRARCDLLKSLLLNGDTHTFVSSEIVGYYD